MKTKKTIIGWKEHVDLPEWGIAQLKAKIDTGAKSSSLHVEDIQELKNDMISFYVVVAKSKERKKVVAKTVRKGKVKSSIGHRTHRWYVETILRVGHVEKNIILNLTCRAEMNYRMLIGRTALHDDFLVDVSHDYLINQE